MTVPTYTPDTTPLESTDVAVIDGAEEPGCPACAHPMAAHDAISARFCRATSAGGHDRGCLCRSA